MLENEFYSQEQHGPFEYFELGDFELESGEILQDASLAYAVHGSLNAERSNAILFTVMFSGTSKNMQAYIGAGKALDPEKYCIIIPNQFGGGLSTSPHNCASNQRMERFPFISIGDDVIAQRKLLTEKFGIEELQLVTGWSMGAQQTYEWAIRFPEMVKRAAPIAGTAKCTPHNSLYVDVFTEALRSDPKFEDGQYSLPHVCNAGLCRLAHVFALMGVCSEFYKQEAWRRLGFSSKLEFMENFWEAWFKPMDPNALIAQARKWKNGDSSSHANGSLDDALARITAKTYVIGFKQDMFVPPVDCAFEQTRIHNSELKIVDSLMGHFAMMGLFEEDFNAINDLFAELLST